MGFSLFVLWALWKMSGWSDRQSQPVGSTTEQNRWTTVVGTCAEQGSKWKLAKKNAWWVWMNFIAGILAAEGRIQHHFVGLIRFWQSALKNFSSSDHLCPNCGRFGPQSCKKLKKKDRKNGKKFFSMSRWEILKILTTYGSSTTRRGCYRNTANWILEL